MQRTKRFITHMTKKKKKKKKKKTNAKKLLNANALTESCVFDVTLVQIADFIHSGLPFAIMPALFRFMSVVRI